MNICPKCAKTYNVEYYKTRGCCSECGFSFKADLHKEVSKEKYNAAIRRKAVEATKSQTNSKLTRCNAASLNNKMNFPNPSPGKKETWTPNEPHKEKDIITENKECNSSPQTANDRLFAADDSTTSNTIPLKDNDAPDDEFTPNWNDAIFLNAEKLEITGDDSDEEYSSKEMQQNNQSADDDVDLDDEYIDGDDIDADTDADSEYAIHDFSTDNKKGFSAFLSNLILFKFVKKLWQRRKEKREEQFETDRKFDFNSDGYYNDVIPEVEPETDIIPLKSILKVISIIIGIFLFITFIIYYA